MTVVKSDYDRRENELYETVENWPIDALFRRFDLAGCSYWEPAAGNHAIAEYTSVEYGCDVFTSDIAFYSVMHNVYFDFFSNVSPPVNPEKIITNPPYGFQNRLAANFARLALQRCSGFVALLLTAGFDSGSSRTDLIRDNPRFWGKIVLLDRMILIPGTDKPGTTDHAWFIWTAEANDHAQLHYERKQDR